MLEGLAVGRIVHYVLADSDVPNNPGAVGRHRPALVVNDWPELGRDDGYANLLVFLDGSNDIGDSRQGVRTVADVFTDKPALSVAAAPFLWATSRLFSVIGEPGTWHWPERAAKAAEAPPHARTAAPGSAFPAAE